MTVISTSEHYYLSCILLAIESGEWQAPFALLFQRWWAVNARPGSFTVDHPDWALTPASVAPDRVDFLSSEAAKSLVGISSEGLRIVPAIPDLTLRDILVDNSVRSVTDVRLALKRWCRFGALTDNDLSRIAAHALESSMPANWRAGQSIYARFETAGVPVQETGTPRPAMIWTGLAGAPESQCENRRPQFLSSTALPVHPW